MLPIIAVILLIPLIDAYALNPHLYVSAENPEFENHFAGSMVIEVIVNDPDLKDINSATGEPDVTINGNNLRMVQATDGSWYAYFAHIDAARTADQIVENAGAIGESLDFGVFCSAASTDSVLGVAFSDTQGVAIARDGVGGTNGQMRPGDCTGPISTQIINNVVRNPKSINTHPGVPPGQIGLDSNAWPIIQLFSFNDVEIKYNKAGNHQQVDLEYDEIPNITMELDRLNYPSGAEVFVTISDIQLNQDPTDEDSWTFNVNSPYGVFYQAYTESGSDSGNGGPGLVNLNAHLSSLDFEDNGQLRVDLSNIMELKTNRDQPDSFVSDGVERFSQIVTFVETQSNSGIFRNYDKSKISNIGILNNAPRGLSGTIQYNDETKSVLSGTFTASLDLGTRGSTLEPGTRATVTVNDADQNINSGERDDLDVFRASAIIPTLEMGEPLTLRGASGVVFYELASTDWSSGTAVRSSVSADSSARLIIDTPSAANTDFTKISFNTGYTANSLRSLLIDGDSNTFGTNWLNYDLRSIQNHLEIDSFSDTSMTLFFGGFDDPSPVGIVDGGDISSAQGFIKIDDRDVDSIASKSGSVFLAINFDASNNSSPEGRINDESDLQPIVVDLFSFGEMRGREINNAIYRLELEETQRNSGIFTGTIEYAVTNQVNIIDANFLSTLRTIGEEIKFLVSGDLLDEKGITISYSDLDSSGVKVSQSTKSDIRTHSGKVTTGSPSYRFGQPVTIILDDPDLNQDHEMIETFSVINDPNSPAVDTVGTVGGNILLEVQIKDFRYQRCMVNGISHDGLGGTGFVLVETGPDTGIFEGTFKMPSRICSEDASKLISPAGGSIDVRYYDFRDSTGNPNIFSLSNSKSPKPKSSTSSPPTLNSDKFTLPKYGQTTQVILSGTLKDHSRGTPLSILLHSPDDMTETFGIIPTNSGDYRAVIILKHNSPTGIYSIEVMYRQDLVGVTSFSVDSDIPASIKDTAKWWADGTAPDSEFLKGIEDLISKDVLETYQSQSSGKLPDWVKKTAQWWGDDLITDDDFISALEYLVKKGIIRI